MLYYQNYEIELDKIEARKGRAKKTIRLRKYYLT